MAAKPIGGDVRAALVLAGFLVLIGVAVADTTLAIVLTPLVYLALAYAMARVPLRLSMMTLMFFAMTLENPAEAFGAGVWKSPFRSVGAILLTHLNSVDPSIRALSFLSFSGMDVCLLTLLLVAAHRKATGSKIDSAGRLSTPRPLARLAVLSLVGTAYVWISGMLRGGDLRMSLWQLDRVMYLPTVCLLFQMGLRGPKDHPALARVILTAATFRALLAVYIMNTVSIAPDPETGSTKLPFATTHHDSMLFASAFVLLLAFLMERVGRRPRRLAFMLLPIVAAGIVFNGRRMAWVQVALVFVTVYVVTPDTPVKRKLRRALYVASPLLLGYVLAGWDSNASVFKPVKMIRSVLDAKADGSTLWREFENFDLIATIRMHPILGTGYGNGYAEVIKLPEIAYELERYAPHNSVLGLWAYCGLFGYTMVTLLWSVGVYFAMRAYHATKDPMHRAAAQVCFGTVLIYVVQCWGDMGLGTWTGVYLAAASIATAGKLAVATGQWGKQKRKEAPHGVGTVPGVPGARQAA